MNSDRDDQPSQIQVLALENHVARVMSRDITRQDQSRLIALFLTAQRSAECYGLFLEC